MVYRSGIAKVGKVSTPLFQKVLNFKKSYLESLKVLDILPVSFQLLRTDLLFLWKLVNGFIDSNLNATFVCSKSRTHQFGHFRISKYKKLKAF